MSNLEPVYLLHQDEFHPPNPPYTHPQGKDYVCALHVSLCVGSQCVSMCLCVNYFTVCVSLIYMSLSVCVCLCVCVSV